MSSKIFIFILCLLFIIFISAKSEGIENFGDYPLGTGINMMSGFGFQEMTLQRPIFVNFYPKELGTDFKLADYLRRLKMERNEPTLYNGLQKPAYTLSRPYPNDISKSFYGYTQISAGRDMTPVIIIPTIGASKIYAKWSKQNGLSVKKLDSYGNFETTDKWNCKDTQNEWTKIWSPQQNVQGLVEYCWSENAKITVTQNGYLDNTAGTSTIVNDIGQLDFESSYYDTLIKALYAIGYVEGSTLFGANYDHRKVSSDSNYFVNSLKSLIDSLGTSVILLGHGFGACVANNFLNSVNQQWRQNKIKTFISVSGTYTGCPKALRVLMSGESLPNSQESKIIRDTTLNYDSLYLMTPNSMLYANTTLVVKNKNNITGSNIPYISQRIGSVSYSVPYVETYKKKMLADSGIPTFSLVGTGINTESSYVYSDFLDNPIQISKKYNGDGTVPDFSLLYPLNYWSKVSSRVYNNAEHTQILSMFEPIRDILEIVKNS
jgi:hypothetical protein